MVRSRARSICRRSSSVGSVSRPAPVRAPGAGVAVAATTPLRIELPDGTQIPARGEATLGERVFVRDGAIEGPAPTLPVELIEI